MLNLIKKNIAYIILGILCFILFFVKLGGVPLVGLDEALYSENSRHMAISGDYITPYYNGNYFFDKPPLVYWMQSSCIKLFGVNSFSVRLPSAIAAVLMVLFIIYLGTKLYGKRTGLISAFMLILSIIPTALARMAILDQIFGLTITLSLGFFILAYLKLTSKWTYLLAWASMGLTAITKGPAGVVLILAVIGTFFIVKKDFRGILKTQLPLGLILFALIAVPWYIAVHKATNGAFTQEFFIHQNLQRAMGKDFYHNMPIFYYLPVFVIGFFPWSMFFPFAWVRHVRLKPQNNEQTASLFMAVWSVVIIGIFSVSTSKLPAYIYPMYPAAALLVGYAWNKAIEEKYVESVYRYSIVTSFIAIAIGIALIIANFSIPDPIAGLEKALVPMGLFMAVGSIMAVKYAYKRMNKHCIIAYGAGMAGFLIFAVFWGLPIASNQSDVPSYKIAQVVKSEIGQKVPVVIYRLKTKLPSVPFYSGRVVEYVDTIDEIEKILSENPRIVLVGDSKGFPKVEDSSYTHLETFGSYNMKALINLRSN